MKADPKTAPKTAPKPEKVETQVEAKVETKVETNPALAPAHDVMHDPQIGQPGRHDQPGQQDQSGLQEAVHGQQHMPALAPGARMPGGVETKTPAPPAEGDRATRRQWDKVKGMAKKSWSQLTEADFDKAGGSLDTLYDVIQEKVGGAREAVKIRLDKLLV